MYNKSSNQKSQKIKKEVFYGSGHTNDPFVLVPILWLSRSIEAPRPQGRASRIGNFINIAPLDPAYKAGLAGHLPVNAEPTDYVKCIYGRLWVMDDYKYYMSLTHEEREQMRTWDVNFYKDQRKLNDRELIETYHYS